MRPNPGLTIFLCLVLLVLVPVIYLKRGAFQFQRPRSAIPVTLLLRDEGKLYHTDLENYLTGVVAAEMPANFSLEALKAQAVAARTIAVNRLRRFGGRGCRHYLGADFCDDPAENQAWLPVSSLKAKWGAGKFQEYYLKIGQAIRQTSGIIIVYQHKPIDAVFHSTCGVGTADAREVWHHQIPYLTSVDCGFDRQSPRYQNQVNYSWAELSQKLNLPAGSRLAIRITERSARGRVIWIAVGQKLFSGEEFRRALSLSSTCFTWKVRQNGIVFHVIGNGHGVGMCQYGADGMAKEGWNYQQILRHYYQGIQFAKIKE
ncbi:MAG: stage II sporulation protein D [Bacillota bacterium]